MALQSMTKCPKINQINDKKINQPSKDLIQHRAGTRYLSIKFRIKNSNTKIYKIHVQIAC